MRKCSWDVFVTRDFRGLIILLQIRRRQNRAPSSGTNRFTGRPPKWVLSLHIPWQNCVVAKTCLAGQLEDSMTNATTRTLANGATTYGNKSRVEQLKTIVGENISPQLDAPSAAEISADVGVDLFGT